VAEVLDQLLFFFADGRVAFGKAGHVGFEGGDVVGGEQDGAAGETGFERIVRGDALAFVGFGTGGVLGVGGVGFGTRVVAFHAYQGGGGGLW
jgi:hypothetical protein